MADVAFAAGFGSVRQFNAAMKDSYRFAPVTCGRPTGRWRPEG